MKITKYSHSCLLLEHDSKQLLSDPGMFTFADGAVAPDTFRDVSTVFITHQHPDHLDVQALRQIVRLSGAGAVRHGVVFREYLSLLETCMPARC
ncbi:MBL fold metallo-hydrolase [Hymenobacter aerilatus]|uniref:MBL fold metallo-hydrolase n=1 Tax=Hymenobacter aerilatus TaxID=2932251 RepID=A0A8T9SY54_9BACT|nr:MBL fold metallo-hydrolase [Hymenobacter aerilatus]UOR06311.1 MBL fold metallo-hydrolase [Hymenobacter aerilatus]